MIPAFETNLAQKKAELAILKTLVYFDIFDYPLSEKDIKNFLGCDISDEIFASALLQLLLDKIIFRVDQFYSLQITGNAQKRGCREICVHNLLL